MFCKDIAAAVGSNHRCNRRKCQGRGTKNPLKVFSTKKPEDHEFITVLYQKMTCTILPSGRSSRSIISDVEEKFGCDFECCRSFQNLLSKEISSRKRKAEDELELANETTKRQREEFTTTPEPPLALTPEQLIGERIALQEEDDDIDEDTDDEELESLLSTPPAAVSSQDTTPASSTSESSTSRSETIGQVTPPVAQRNILRTARKKRASSKDVFLEKFVRTKKMYHGSYSSKKCTTLHPRRHVIRSDLTLCHLLCLAGYDEEDINDINNNSEIFEEVMSLISSAKARLMKHTGLTSSSSSRLSSNLVDELEPPPPPPSTINERSEAKKEMQSLLIAKLPKHEYTKANYLHVKSGGKKFESYYTITKDLPKVQEFKCEYWTKGPDDLPAIELEDNDGTMLPSAHVDETMVTSTDSDDMNKKVTVLGAYVTLEDCVNLLLKKIQGVVAITDGMTMEKAMDGAFFLTCADGAQHNKLPKEDRNVITYSITLVSRALIEHCGIYPSSSKWIISHVQLQAKENLYTLKSVLQFRLKDYVSIAQQNPLLTTVPMYDIADGKALYIYTEHSHWSSKYKPFLRCTCERGQFGVCKIVPDDKYKEMQLRSKERWATKPKLDSKRQRLGRNPYSVSDHKKWCSLANNGITHFGALGMDYNCSQLWFDVFHGRGGIVKVFLKYIRNMMEGLECRNYKCVSLFGAYLRKLKHWDGYVTDPWISNDTQSRLKGNHTKEFVRDIPKAISVIKSLLTGEKVNDFCVCLDVFRKMSEIVSLIIIDKYECVKHVLLPNSKVTVNSPPNVIAEEVIKTYEYYAKKLYEHGRLTVLTRHDEGDAETLYFHCFRFYIPYLMRKLYRLHRLGIACMTMEGFEHKNFTSKHAVQTRTNGRGNVLKQSMRVLHLFFKSGYHNVIRELEQRVKAESPSEIRLTTVNVEQLIDDYLTLV